MASAGARPGRRYFFSSEPALTPMRIGTFFWAARRMIAFSFSLPPMLPGLMRMPWAPFSMAPRAREASKWMSAITGSGERATMRSKAGKADSLRDGDAHDVAAGGLQPGDLRQRACDILGGGVGHRLDGNGMSAADPHPADKDLPLHK